MNLVKNKLAESKKIVELMAAYHEKLSSIIAESYKDTDRNIREVIKNFPAEQKKIIEGLKILESTKEINVLEITKVIYNFFTALSSYYVSIANIFGLFTAEYMKPTNIHQSFLSDTYKAQLENQLDQLQKYYRTYKEKYKIDDLHLLNGLSDMIVHSIKFEKLNYKSTIAVYDEIRNLFYKNKNTVELYANTIQKLIDKIDAYTSIKSTDNVVGDKFNVKDKSTDTKNAADNVVGNKFEIKNALYKIILCLEEDKDEFLKIQDIKNVHNPKNPPIKRFGLIQNSNSMPIKELLKLILNVNITGKVNLRAIAKTHKAVFIIIEKITYNPVEFSIFHVNNQKYFEPPEYGITDKFIKKTNTIINMDKSKHANNLSTRSARKSARYDYKFTYDVICDPPIKWDDDDINEKLIRHKFFALETIDGENYRVLTPWLFGNSYAMQYFRVKPLIDFINSKKLVTRICDYQKNCINNSLPNMFLLKPMPLDMLLEDSKAVDSQIIRNEIFNRILAEFLKKSKGMKSVDNFTDFLHSAHLGDMLVENVMKMYSRSLINEVSKFPFSELLVTYINSLNKLSRQFLKELHDNYSKTPMKNLPMPEELRRRFEEILKDSLESVISNKTNIYQEFIYKNSLLNYK